MNPAFVLDSSVALTWLFTDELTSKTAALLKRLADEVVIVPALWSIEIANVVATAERKGRITSLQTAAFISDLARFDIEQDDEGALQAFTHVLPLCRLYKLTSYDALYLELAVRRRIPLATLDADLRKAATKAGVSLLGK